MLERAIGSILVCASQNIGMFIEGRIVNGLVGIETAQVPASDTVAPSSAANSNYYDTAAFRVPWGNQIIPTIGIFFAMTFLPE